MNLHPIIVHFPIAFLTIYSIFELARFSFLLNRPYWLYVKAALAIVGSLGTALALFTGDMAGEVIRQDAFLRPVARAHENFADISTGIFAVLAVSYLILILQKENLMDWVFSKPAVNRLWNSLVRLAGFFVQTRAVIVLAVLGLICITITGGLGGAMVYGPKADPFFEPVFHLITRQ